jgi:putative ABC transport system permease protein
MLFSDLRHSIRLLTRTPTLTTVALLSIAITIGATAVVFTAVKSVILEPLPYAHATELVQFRGDYKNAKSQAAWVTWSDMQDVARGNHSFTSVGTYSYALFNLAADRNAPPEALYGLNISANMFPTLGVAPMLGRNILPEEDQPGRNRVMMLSYALWTRRFHSDRQIIGQTVEVNGHDCTIVGVMPPGFDFPMRQATTVRTPSQHMDFWAALGKDPTKQDRTSGAGAVARLLPGVTVAQAEQDVKAIGDSLARQYPLTNKDRSLHVESLRDQTIGFARTGLLLLMGAALMFLLIGCANVANLLLARAFKRHREISIRLALGASRGRIARQLVTESCVLAVLGGLGGYALTVFAWTLLPAVAPMTIPRLAAARADWTVFAFTLAVSILNGILFAIVPALRTSQQDPALALTGARGSVGAMRNTFRSTLVAGEVAIAVTLVVIGGLLTGSFVRLLRTDPGFEPNHVLASIIIVSGDQYKTPEQRGVLFARIVDSVRALPGVEIAGTVDALPFSGENHGGEISKGESETAQIGEIDRVSSDYLAAMGVPLLEGRMFRADDMDNTRDTAIVNSVAAANFWPNETAVGKRLCLFCSNPQFRQWKQVIGVVKTARHANLNDAAQPEVYYAGGAFRAAQFLVVRTPHPNADLARAIRQAVAAIDPKQPVFMSAALSTMIGDSIADRRFIMTLLAITGALALLLSAAGVYGVVSYATSLRTQEIGVRMALGATPRQVQVMIFRQGMHLAGIGVIAGLAMALTLTKLLSSALAGLTTTNPTLIALAVTLVTATAAIACLIPATRATKVDPINALRQE